MNEIYFVLRVYLWIMSGEASVYSIYLHTCLKHKYTSHALYYWSVVCLAILCGEIIRAACILRGLLPYTPKHIAVFEVELFPFGIVTYEIAKRYYDKVFRRLAQIWM